MNDLKRGLESLGKDVYYGARDRVSSRTTVEVDTVSATFPSYFVENFTWTVNSERPVLRDLLTNIETGDTFYDIGAHAGLYSALVGQKIERTIAAFEPYPPNVRRLRRYLRWNDVDAEIYPYALSDSEIDSANLAGDIVQVDTRIGDDLVQSERLSPPDVVKIDVEGAELSVLRGLEQTLKECRLVYCEVHPALLESRQIEPHKVSDFLEERGFNLEMLVVREASNEQPILRAERQL